MKKITQFSSIVTSLFHGPSYASATGESRNDQKLP